MSKKNVYVVLTEYQFLQALNIATGVYSTSEYINIIYLIRNGRRLKGIDETKNRNTDNIEIHFLDGKQHKEIAMTIEAEKPDNFLIFQATFGLNIYLGYTLSKRGAQVSLGPDGYNAYAYFNKRFALLSVIKDSFTQNLDLIKNKLFSSKLHRFNYYTYGNQPFFNKLWLTHPNQYKHRATNKVELVQLPQFNEKCLDLIRDFFEFKADFPTKDVIYFFNQPLWTELVDTEYDFVVDVLKQFPDKLIVAKLHPLTSKEMKQKYTALDRVQIIESNVPAEVLLLNLKNCIVFTGWSSVLITENRYCNYYFNFPLFKKIPHRLLDQLELTVLDHIKLINSPGEMSFPTSN